MRYGVGNEVKIDQRYLKVDTLPFLEMTRRSMAWWVARSERSEHPSSEYSRVRVKERKAEESQPGTPKKV